jgi:hypothetical protein
MSSLDEQYTEKQLEDAIKRCEQNIDIFTEQVKQQEEKMLEFKLMLMKLKSER